MCEPDCFTVRGRGMRIKIAIITTEFLRDFINNSFRELKPGFSYTIYSYATFEELSSIYRSIPESTGGVITSGAFPTWIIERSFPDTTRVIRTINNDDGDIWKLALQLMSTRSRLSLKRIYADAVDVFGMDLPEYVSRPWEKTFTERVNEVLRDKDLAYLIGMEGFYRDKHLQLWREGRVDVSITRFSSIMPTLRDAGLAAYFAYPGLAYMARVCRDTLQAISLKHFQDNQIAAIIVTPEKVDEHKEAARRHEVLHRVLGRFSALCPFDILPRQTPAGHELLTNRKAVQALTEGFRACRIQQSVRPYIDFAFNVGYGLGGNIYQARLNAMDANREASLSASGSSCLVNESDELIGPLQREEKLVVSRDISPMVRETAKRSGLSYLTVQKVAAAMSAAGRHEITSRELASFLSITSRSANRFLRALHETGIARVVDVRRGTSRGRPERVYHIEVGKLG